MVFYAAICILDKNDLPRIFFKITFIIFQLFVKNKMMKFYHSLYFGLLNRTLQMGMRTLVHAV
jgi:hypothetical protein